MSYGGYFNLQPPYRLLPPLSFCSARKSSQINRPDFTGVYQIMMALIAEKGWSQTTMAEISAKSFMTEEEIKRFYPNLNALLAGYLDDQMQQLFAQPTAQLLPDAPFSRHREYLFTLMMNYMDLLQPYRLTYRQIQKSLPISPGLGRVLLTHAYQFLQQALEKSQLLGRLPAKAASFMILPAWLRVLRAWRQDEAIDLSVTMKKLDNQLKQAQEYWHYLPPLVRRMLAV